MGEYSKIKFSSNIVKHISESVSDEITKFIINYTFSQLQKNSIFIYNLHIRRPESSILEGRSYYRIKQSNHEIVNIFTM